MLYPLLINVGPQGRRAIMLGLVPLIAAQATVAATTAAPPAKAQAAQSQDIIVTGERVKRALRDTPSSVAVITAPELEATPADRMEQLLAGIPNVRVGSGSQGPAIRGQDSTGVLNNLAAFLGGARPRATLEVDGRAVGFQEFVFGNAPLWDVRQVEVFRSPLTVTHGRNSIGGGIIITTNDPTYDWEGSGRAIIGDFSTREGSAVVSGPLVTDQVTFRLAGDIRRQRTTSRLADVMRGANPNDDKYSIVRLKLLGEPAAVSGLKLLGTFTHSYSQAPQAVLLLRPFRKRFFPFGGYGIFGVKVDAGTVHATQQVPDGQIEAVVSLGDTRTRRFAQPGFGESRAHFTDLSGEVFGNWKPSEIVTLRGGIHALDSRFSQHIDLINFMGSIGDFKDRQHSFGAFAEGEVTVTPRLSLSAGGRYQEDRQQRTGGLVGAVNAPIVFDARFSAFLPKFTATFALNPRLKAGFLVQKAYNPGGATLDFDTGGLDTFGAEHLWDYEAFLKGDLPGGKVSIETNVFYNAIRNAQRVVAVPITTPGGTIEFTSKVNNVPKASIEGAEVEVHWRPSRGLTLRGGIGLLRTRIIGGRNSDGEIIGREFQASPHVSGSAAADWTPTRHLRLSAQLRYHGRYFSDDFDTPELRIGRAAIVDVRAAYSFHRFTVFAYARNVFDSFHVTLLADPDIAEAEDPRVVGVGLEARF
jgi:outer membrane receptor protein involved in Fe transport